MWKIPLRLTILLILSVLIFCGMTLIFAIVYPVCFVYTWIYFPIVCIQVEKTWFAENKTPPKADDTMQIFRQQTNMLLRKVTITNKGAEGEDLQRQESISKRAMEP